MDSEKAILMYYQTSLRSDSRYHDVLGMTSPR